MTLKLVYAFESKDLHAVLDQLGDKMGQPGFIPKLVKLTPKLVKTDPQVGQNRPPSWLMLYIVTTCADSGESASNASIISLSKSDSGSCTGTTSGVRRFASSLATSILMVVMNH